MDYWSRFNIPMTWIMSPPILSCRCVLSCRFSSQTHPQRPTLPPTALCPGAWKIARRLLPCPSPWSNAHCSSVNSLIIVSNSFLLLLVRHLLLVAMHLFLIAYCFPSESDQTQLKWTVVVVNWTEQAFQSWVSIGVMKVWKQRVPGASPGPMVIRPAPSDQTLQTSGPTKLRIQSSKEGKDLSLPLLSISAILETIVRNKEPN